MPEKKTPEDGIHRPIARTFDDMIEQFGIDIYDIDAPEEELPGLFAAAPEEDRRKMREDFAGRQPTSKSLHHYLRQIDAATQEPGAGRAAAKRQKPGDRKHMEPEIGKASKKQPAAGRGAIQGNHPAEMKPAPPHEDGTGFLDEAALPEGRATGKTGKAYGKMVTAADWVIGKYHTIVPRRSYARSTPLGERLAVLAAAIAVIAVIAVGTTLIVEAIPARITGRWQVSDGLVMEFTSGGEAILWVSQGAEEKAYQRGTYELARSDGRNLLTIRYEDGLTRRLYYIIEGDVGYFTNVDTNMEAQYQKIK